MNRDSQEFKDLVMLRGIDEVLFVGVWTEEDFTGEDETAYSKRIVYMDKKELLQSPFWHYFRKAAIEIYGLACGRCGATGRLDLHHRHYLKPYGLECIADVVLLCRSCHTRAHTLPSGSFCRDPQKVEEKWAEIA